MKTGKENERTGSNKRMRANMGSTRRTCAVRKRTEQKTRKQGTRKDGTAAFARRASPPRLRQRLGTHLAGWTKVRCRQHVSLHRALTDGGGKKVQRHCVRSPSGHPSHTCVRACCQDLQHVPARRKRASFTRGQTPCTVGGQEHLHPSAVVRCRVRRTTGR